MKPSKSRKIISPSVSFEVAAYLKHLPTVGINASQEVDDAVRATAGYEKWLKERNEKTLKDIGWNEKQETS